MLHEYIAKVNYQSIVCHYSITSPQLHKFNVFLILPGHYNKEGDFAYFISKNL